MSLIGYRKFTCHGRLKIIAGMLRVSFTPLKGRFGVGICRYAASLVTGQILRFIFAAIYEYEIFMLTARSSLSSGINLIKKIS